MGILLPLFEPKCNHLGLVLSGINRRDGAARGRFSGKFRHAILIPSTAIRTRSGGNPLRQSSVYSYISDEALLSLDSMEGIHQLPKSDGPKPRPKARPWWAYVPAVLVTALAYGLHYLPVPPFRVVAGQGARYPVSAAIIAIVAGVLVRNLLPQPAPGIESAKGLARRIIPVTIVLTGAGLNLLRVASVGTRALLITGVCMAVSMIAAVLIGRSLG